MNSWDHGFHVDPLQGPGTGASAGCGPRRRSGQEEQRPLLRRQTWSSWGDGASNCRILGVWGCQPPALAPALTQHLLPGGGAMAGVGVRTCSSRPLAGILPSSSHPLSLQHHPSGGGRRGGTSPASQSLAGGWSHGQLQGATLAASQAEEEVPGLNTAFRGRPQTPPVCTCVAPLSSPGTDTC